MPDPISKPTAAPGPPTAADAFRAALLRIIPDLRAFGRALASDPDGADDLVQETLVRAWAAQKNFDPTTNIRAWTFTILRNAHYSRWHKTKREIAWDPDLDQRLSTSPGQDSGINLADLHRALYSLPDTQREALILVGAAGWTYDEAAAICHCQPGTIKSRVSRARAALQALEASPTPAPAPRSSSESAFKAILEEIDDGITRWQALPAA